MNKSRLTDFIFPPRCCGCDRLTRSDSPFCADCEGLIVATNEKKSACDICGMELTKCLCGKKLFYHSSATVFFHEGEPRKVIFKLKFHARRDIAKTYARALKIILDKRNILDETDAITCIPMSMGARLIRGYNQSELIARALAEVSDKEFVPFLIKAVKTPKQHRVENVSRKANVLGVFEPDKAFEKEIEGKRILIIDDVCTTGNTLNEAAKTLFIFGAEDVFIGTCTTRKKNKKNC